MCWRGNVKKKKEKKMRPNMANFCLLQVWHENEYFNIMHILLLNKIKLVI